MKSLLAIAAVLAFSAVPAFAADGYVSQNSLSKMGLSGMKSISEEKGMEIRGLAIAVVGGHSTASVPGATSSNFYFASGHHEADGKNLSFAGVAVVSNQHVAVVTVFAGGSSQAHA